ALHRARQPLGCETLRSSFARPVERPEAEDCAAGFEVPEARRVVADAVDDRVRDVARENRTDEAGEIALRHPRRGVARELLLDVQTEPARRLGDAGVVGAIDR